ncbi:hypothetical protein L7750_04750 [Xenorhabdus bovienii]|nr:hypothetical protein [Xenorhabdus bovienii]MCG3469729.1 hypothetical protein [Xenorhabdus bovienii]
MRIQTKIRLAGTVANLTPSRLTVNIFFYKTIYRLSGSPSGGETKLP